MRPSLPLSLFLLLTVSASAFADFDYRFTGGPNVLGDADQHGHLSVWRDFGTVDFGEGISLPLRIQFCSGRTAHASIPSEHDPASPYLGRGWLCPLLESHIMRYDFQQGMDVLLPDGQAVSLVLDGPYLPTATKGDPKPVAFHSADGRWSGTLAPDSGVAHSDVWRFTQKDSTILRGDLFTMKSETDGWELSFLHGRIVQWKMKKQTLEWIYKGDLVSEIRVQDAKGDAPLKVTLGADGHPEGFVVDGRECHFKFATFPVSDTFGFVFAENKTFIGYGEWLPGDKRSTALYSAGTEPGFTLTFHDTDGIATFTSSQFTGAQMTQEFDHLGYGWQLTFPDGRKLEISGDVKNKNGANELSIAASNGEWQGTAQPAADTVTLKSTNGVELTFVKGRLHQWRNGTHTMEWSYDKGGAPSEISVLGNDGNPMLGFVLDAGGRAVKFRTREHLYDFSTANGHFPEIIFDHAVTPTLAEWSGPRGEHEKYALATDSGTPPMLAITDTTGAVIRCSWTPSTRQIVSADGWEYAAPYVRDERDFPPAIARTNEHGETESITPGAAPTRTVTTSTLADGVTIATYLRRMGAPCDEIQRLQKIGLAGVIRTVYVADFDEVGNPVREFKVSDKGEVTLTTHAANGESKTENLPGVDAIRTTREQAFLDDMKNATGLVRDHAIEQLAYIYVEAGEYQKALDLRQQTKNGGLLYLIVGEVVYADKKIQAGGIAAHRALLMGASLKDVEGFSGQ